MIIFIFLLIFILFFHKEIYKKFYFIYMLYLILPQIYLNCKNERKKLNKIEINNFLDSI